MSRAMVVIGNSHCEHVWVMPGSKVLHKRAEDIEIGDRMWAQAEEKDTTAAVYVVKRIDTVPRW
jgi:hypothetical protein